MMEDEQLRRVIQQRDVRHGLHPIPEASESAEGLPGAQVQQPSERDDGDDDDEGLSYAPTSPATTLEGELISDPGDPRGQARAREDEEDEGRNVRRRVNEHVITFHRQDCQDR